MNMMVLKGKKQFQYCAYCVGGESLFWKSAESNAFINSGGEIFVTVKDHSVRFNVMYCPMCGRKFDLNKKEDE